MVNKTRILFLPLFIGVLNLFYTLQAQNFTSIGTDFWLTFMDNIDNRLGGEMLKVFVSGDSNCTAILSNPNTGWSQTANVVPGVVSIISVPQIQGYSTIDEQVKNTGLHLTSNSPVTVYASTMGMTSYDIANVYPTVTLRDDYMIQSYPSDWYGSEFVIVATEDNTWVDIILSSSSSMGHNAGDTVSVFFSSAGKCFQMKTPSVGDFSGTRIISRECKKIAVFQGDVCVYIPSRSNGGTCDHAVEQAVPVANWGRKFVVMPSSENFADRVRVTSLFDSCHLTINGVDQGFLMSAETHDFIIPTGSGRTAALVDASLPVSVCLFFASTGMGTGDPSMVTISPVEQMMNHVTFISRSSTYTNQHFVNILVKTEDIPLLRCDNSMISQQLFHTCQFDNNYSYVCKNLGTTTQSHTISMEGGSGFNAYAFGLGNHESYAFIVGSAMNDLSNYFVINDRIIPDGGTYDICFRKNVKISLFCYEGSNNLTWYFDDGTIVPSDTVTHLFQQPGQYHVYVVRNTDSISCFPSTDTMNVLIRVSAADSIESTLHLCDEEYFWFGDTLDVTGTYTFYDSVPNQCDTVWKLNLSIGHNDSIFTSQTTCDSLITDSVIYYVSTDIPTRHFTNEEGCDSFVLSKIIINYSSYKETDVYIHTGDTFTWIDGRQYWDTSANARLRYTTVGGCDSIIKLNLHFLDTIVTNIIDTTAIWVPNAFTPELPTNKYFCVKSVGVEKMDVYIYTRQGILVKKFDGLTESWDGTLNGKPCKKDAYVYIIEYIATAMPGYKKQKLGTVVLIR